MELWLLIKIQLKQAIKEINKIKKEKLKQAKDKKTKELIKILIEDTIKATKMKAKNYLKLIFEKENEITEKTKKMAKYIDDLDEITGDTKERDFRSKQRLKNQINKVKKASKIIEFKKRGEKINESIK